MRVTGGIQGEAFALHFVHNGEELTLTFAEETIAQQYMKEGAKGVMSALAYGIELALKSLMGEPTETPDVKVTAPTPTRGKAMN